VIQSSLSKPPERMLDDCLGLLNQISGADRGSIQGEEGPNLSTHFAADPSLTGVKVPWDSIAGANASRCVVIYTYAPKDTRHYSAIGADLQRQTNYLLSVPIPSVHRSSEKAGSRSPSAGCLQLLFDEDIFPDFDVSAGPREFELADVRDQAFYGEALHEVTLILPNIALGMEIMLLRQTSYQAIHELKNKLISAQSWLNCLREDVGELSPEALADEGVTEDFALAESAIQDGAKLAVSYLQFTKIYNPAFESAAVNPVVAETAAAIRAFAGDLGGGVTVTAELADGLPALQLDPSQLKMALFNLGKNGVEALTTLGVESPAIRLRTEPDDSGVRIVVSDNGPGMPPEIAQNLFVAFKTKKSGGTGLGLTITKKIIEVHNGTIDCQTGDTGTTFTIRLSGG
jgi:signal transduction histidine kinase